MVDVTGGRVVIEDGVKKTEEYAPPRKVLVEIKFDVPEGGDAQGALNIAAAIANAKVRELLGQASGEVIESTRVVSRDAGTVGETTRRTRRTKEQIAADEAAKNASAQSSQPETTGGAGGSPSDPLGDLGGTTAADALDLEQNSADNADDGLGDLLGEPEPAKEISNDELNAAVQKKNAEIKKAPAIRELIAKFNPKPGTPFVLSQLPQAERPKFLAELGALT